MPSPFENPVIRYGMGFGSAVILTVVAFTVLDGLARWIVLGMAVLEILVVPQILKLATENAAETA
ncbi:hypothetical protein [Natrinema caseinilyticum]|uniref:hypothetical protein n=1 Tax=Natrinema caseinilyticum TaxID=2961570 RepID=UPI0020C1E8F9|nr:hypothetical protein [Natrinema caseinilyticum]